MLYTENYLIQKYRNRIDQRNFNNIVNEHRRKHSTFDIFLCNSYQDREVIGGLFMEFTEMGYSVYLDWVTDSHLSRANVTKASCELIRNRMENCSSLFYAVSYASTGSKWMPWELGFMDGKKSKCAILPITDVPRRVDYPRQEYLSLYPYVIRGSIANYYNYNNFNGNLWIAENKSTYVSFSNWLKYGFKPNKQSTILS